MGRGTRGVIKGPAGLEKKMDAMTLKVEVVSLSIGSIQQKLTMLDGKLLDVDVLLEASIITEVVQVTGGI